MSRDLRVELAVLSAIKWDRQYHAMLATPLRVRDIVLGHQAFFASRLLMTATIYLVVITAFGPWSRLSESLRSRRGPRRDRLRRRSPPGLRLRDEVSFVAIFRFVILLMFLFSRDVLPDHDQLPRPLEGIAYVRRSGTASRSAGTSRSGHRALGQACITSYVLAWVAAGLPRLFTYRSSPTVGFRSLANNRNETFPLTPSSWGAEPPGLPITMSRGPAHRRSYVVRACPDRDARIRGLLLIERNAMVYRRTWMILFSGFFEPLFYLFFFVYPLERFIGDVTSSGRRSEYSAFVAPALLAASAMNGAFYDATNVFWKLRYGKVYDSILSTPVGAKDVAVGETIWAVVRAMLYSAALPRCDRHLGLVESWWAILRCPPASSSASAAGAGSRAYLDADWKGLDLVQLIACRCSCSPRRSIPSRSIRRCSEWIVRALPLYGIELVRSLTTGTVGPYQLVNVAYLAPSGSLACSSPPAGSRGCFSSRATETPAAASTAPAQSSIVVPSSARPPCSRR